MKLLIAFNGKTKLRNLQKVTDLADNLRSGGHEVKTIDSHHPELANEVGHFDHICIAGGDGTARDVVQTLTTSEQRIPISIFPLGTINLIAREAIYSNNVGEFVEYMKIGRPAREHFYGQYGNAVFLSCLSIGPDSYAVNQVSKKLKRKIGRLAYLVSFLKISHRWQRKEMNVSCNNSSFQAEAVFILKGRFFAGPWSLAEDANIQDPAFSLLLLPIARRRDYLRLILSVTMWSGFADSNWLRSRTNAVHIEGPDGLPVQADGDIVGFLPQRISISAQSLSFI